jgi:phospholipase C
MLGIGDAAFYQDSSGKAIPPPTGQIENPDAKPTTNNNYTQDGYGNSSTGNGGSYSNCSDHIAHGVKGAFDYLNTLSHPVANLCAKDHYYLLNNYNPGYNVDGSLNNTTFTVPPQHSLKTIGDALSARGISWGYFGEGYNNGNVGPNYCCICDPMQYSSSIMTNPGKRARIQHGLADFDNEVNSGKLPAVSLLKPGDDNGHPATRPWRRSRPS